MGIYGKSTANSPIQIEERKVGKLRPSFQRADRVNGCMMNDYTAQNTREKAFKKCKNKAKHRRTGSTV